uniref:Uncharacterized protein n=1 Tax=Candidatus Kentrum sp. LFY TaxID=2126342 RepID=A0A450UL10_9GAMM|nr:MAG: hypothetical protein BECKLFY1418A_GA0070994_10302 [Candidatus Kentron sp. LFY]
MRGAQGRQESGVSRADKKDRSRKSRPPNLLRCPPASHLSLGESSRHRLAIRPLDGTIRSPVIHDRKRHENRFFHRFFETRRPRLSSGNPIESRIASSNGFHDGLKSHPVSDGGTNCPEGELCSSKDRHRRLVRIGIMFRYRKNKDLERTDARAWTHPASVLARSANMFGLENSSAPLVTKPGRARGCTITRHFRKRTTTISGPATCLPAGSSNPIALPHRQRARKTTN